jgi:hypothetical protein
MIIINNKSPLVWDLILMEIWDFFFLLLLLKIVQLLSESYRGKAQMINLLSYWLSLVHSDAEIGKESAHQMIEGHLKSLLLQRFDPRKADSIFSEKAVLRSLFFFFFLLINN